MLYIHDGYQYIGFDLQSGGQGFTLTGVLD